MQNFTLENPLFRIFSKIFYNNNQNVTIIYSKKKKFRSEQRSKERGEKRRKYIKKQQIRNQNLKTVPIPMENKKKRTTHPEI